MQVKQEKKVNRKESRKNKKEERLASKTMKMEEKHGDQTTLRTTTRHFFSSLSMYSLFLFIFTPT